MIGSIKFLLPTCLRHILHYTLAPKVGDSHNLRSMTIDLFVYAHEKNKVDILDFMFAEIR